MPAIFVPRRPLVVTSDDDLLDDVLRLAAAGGSEVDLAPDPANARPRYAAAPFVLIGVDQARACLQARLPRRPRVVIVAAPQHASAAWELSDPLGVEHVAVLPSAEPWLVDRFSQPAGTLDAAPRGVVVAVVGGRGGAGASVFAGGLAVTAKKAGLRTLLIDADRFGGGLDLVLGWEEIDGLRWPALSESDGHIDAAALVGSLPNQGGLIVLSWDRGELLALPAEAMAAILDAGRRACDLVVVDLPRQFDDAAVVALGAAVRTFIVVPAELRAAFAAARVVAAVQLHCVDLSLIVRGPSPGRLKAKDMVEQLHVPLAGTLRPESAIVRALERGEAPASSGRGPLASLCQRIVADLMRATREASA